jgi:hypothetical protein
MHSALRHNTGVHLITSAMTTLVDSSNQPRLRKEAITNYGDDCLSNDRFWNSHSIF